MCIAFTYGTLSKGGLGGFIFCVHALYTHTVQCMTKALNLVTELHAVKHEQAGQDVPNTVSYLLHAVKYAFHLIICQYVCLFLFVCY